LGNLIIGVVLVLFVFVTNRTINLDFAYHFIGPTVIGLCLLLPFFFNISPVTFNIVMSTGFGVFDVIIWYMVAQSSYDNQVSGFVIGAIVRSISLVARLIGILVGSLFIRIPDNSNILLVALLIGSGYLLLVWLMTYRRYLKRRDYVEGGQDDTTDVGTLESAVVDAAPLNLDQIFDERAKSIAGIYQLTRREAEVLPYLLRGRSASYIADVLFVSENTVRSHIRHILEKTGARSKHDLMDIAV
jgi:DNA-binding CsgD family transcriptional regulator